MADNPEINCILEVCCGGDDTGKQVRALASLMNRELPSHANHIEVSEWLIGRFDFAEKGTLKPFKDSIALLARGFPYQG